MTNDGAEQGSVDQSEEIIGQVPSPAMLGVVIVSMHWLLTWPHGIEFRTHGSSFIFLATQRVVLNLIFYLKKQRRSEAKLRVPQPERMKQVQCPKLSPL